MQQFACPKPGCDNVISYDHEDDIICPKCKTVCELDYDGFGADEYYYLIIDKENEMKTTSSGIGSSNAGNTKTHVPEKDGYSEFLPGIQNNFIKMLGNEGLQVFTTDAKNLFEIFLEGLPENARQHYRCNACKGFVNRYGNLVVINKKGVITSLLWDTVTTPSFFIEAIQAMQNEVVNAKVTGVFFSAKPMWGINVTGKWHHMHVIPHTAMVFASKDDANRKMAEKKEEYKMVLKVLTKYSFETVSQVAKLLKSDSLYRSEKCLGNSLWLKEVYQNITGSKNFKKNNHVLWRHVAYAPTGFCHISGGMLGTLLDDVASGHLNFDAIAKKFESKMNPTKYQRPSKAPTEGNVAQAEKVFEKLNCADSLPKRFAKIEELTSIWRPRGVSAEKKTTREGVFSDLKTRKKEKATFINNIEIPEKVISMRTFLEDIMPDAEKIHIWIPGYERCNFAGITTAINPTSRPILQWDHEDKRNPFSSYVYSGGSFPASFMLESNKYYPCDAVVVNPCHWNDSFKHTNHGEGIIFIIQGCKDRNYEGSGMSIFPEDLKSEFHSVRSTIEQYSRQHDLEGYDEASACGLRFDSRMQDPNSWNISLVTESEGEKYRYIIKYWK